MGEGRESTPCKKGGKMQSASIPKNRKDSSAWGIFSSERNGQQRLIRIGDTLYSNGKRIVSGGGAQVLGGI